MGREHLWGSLAHDNPVSAREPCSSNVLMSSEELLHEGNGLSGLIEHQMVSGLGNFSRLHLWTGVFNLL